MIFHSTLEMILAGKKTQTRRLVQEGEHCLDGRSVSKTWMHRVLGTTQHRSWVPYRPKWVVGHTYAIQPGRGKKAVGQIRLIAIRRERLREITAEDAMAEGIHLVPEGYWESEFRLGWFASPRAAFAALWDSIHRKTGTQWADNPLVWVLEFEVIDAKGETRDRNEP